MVLFTIIALVVSIALQQLLTPKPKFEDAKPQGLGEFDQVTATEGRVQPVIYGTVFLKGLNLIGVHDFKPIAIVTKVKTGMFSSKKYVSGYRYTIGLVLAACRGVATLKKLRIGDVDVFDGTATGGARVDIDEPDLFGEGNGFASSVDFASGTQTQLPNDYLNTAGRERITTAITPTSSAYRGLAYLVFRELTGAAPSASDIGAYIGNQNTLQQIGGEFQRFPALFAGQTAGQNIIGTYDANPANVIYEYLTDPIDGLGRSPATIDVGAGSSFVRASNTFIAEGNGFSMPLTVATRGSDFLKILQDQIDGLVVFNHATGLWEINLAREPGHAYFGYDPDTIPALNADNVLQVDDWSNGSWDETSTAIKVEFNKREDDYKQSFAFAQDLGGAILRASGATAAPVNKGGQLKFPGVKDSALAAQLATRELKGRAIPLKRGTFIVDRSLWALKQGDPFTYTDPTKGIDKLVMRALRISYGRPESRRMTITAVQDEFAAETAIFADPPGTKWTPATAGLVAFPADEQLAIEAPRAIVVRDPDYSGDPQVCKLFAAARGQSREVGFTINQRNAAGTPSGSFTLAGSVYGLVKIGSLAADLDAGSTYPTTLTLTASPDSQSELEEQFVDASTLADLGTDLVQLLLVGDEFMLAQSAATSGADVLLSGVYRGALDSAQAAHSLGDPVFLIFVGAGLSDTNFANTNNADVQLRPRSIGAVFSGTTSTIALTFAKRALRPYPPAALLYNGSGTVFTAPDLEGDGTGLNGVGFDVNWRRRRFDVSDEVAALLSDDTTVDSSHETRIRVLVGAVEVFDSGWVTGAGPVTVPQVNVVNRGAAGTDITIEANTRHDYAGETQIESLQLLEHVATPTSTRTAQFYLGAAAASVALTAYTAAATGTFTLRIGTAYSTSAVQVSINGGGFATVITAGSTSGTFSATSGDTIAVRHTVNESPALNFVELENPSASLVAYGVLRGA